MIFLFLISLFSILVMISRLYFKKENNPNEFNQRTTKF
jgi:hypothetical protein